MNAELFEALDLLQKTKGIPVDYMLEKIEAALVSAYKKEEGSSSVRVAINKEKKDLKVFSQRKVVEEVTDPKSEISLEDAKAISRRYTLDSVVEKEVKTKNFGRISAQIAKQVIVQGIREAEKSNIIRDYERKREEVIAALVVKRDDKTGDVVVDTGTSNALLPTAEQIPGEDLYVGDRVKVFVSEVRREGEKGPIVTISRTHPGLMKRLLETQIPEIEDGIVLV
ncbi:MAG: transcription termination/antitermination protein NusA, partial [Clostridia bacterium]|nr:transcription termination/antitermination protein NusA [Clostridia bacterium]